MDIKVLEKVVNKKYSLPKLLKKLNEHNRYDYERPCFCPFHDNTNTPAAVIYNDPDGDRLWCYAEQKMYKPSDVLSKLYKQDIYELGSNLFSRMTESERAEYTKEQDYSKMFEDDSAEMKESKELMLARYAYKESKIKLSEYLEKVLAEINSRHK